MSGSIRLFLTILAVVFFGYVGIMVVRALVLGLVHALVSLIVPLAIVAGVAVVLYTMINRRAIGPGKRILP